MSRTRKQRSRGFPATAPQPVVNIAQARSKRAALQPDRKTGIFLACPTASGRVNFSIAMTFGRAMASSAMAECPFNFTIHCEVAQRPVDYARNRIVRVFLHESDADWLIMADEDQVVPDNFWHLCTVHDADVVSALTPVWVGNMDPETMLRVNNYGLDEKNRCYNLPIPPDSQQQPYAVPIVGTGMIAIRRRVFAPKPHGVGDSPFYFTYMPDRKVMGGEDVNFSVECQRAGFTLAAHPGVRCDHIKEMPLWQIDRYYHARRDAEAAGRAPTVAQRLSIG
jgi:hypothetical protein